MPLAAVSNQCRVCHQPIKEEKAYLLIKVKLHPNWSNTAGVTFQGGDKTKHPLLIHEKCMAKLGAI